MCEHTLRFVLYVYDTFQFFVLGPFGLLVIKQASQECGKLRKISNDLQNFGTFIFH